MLGRIGVAVSPADGRRVYAVVEAEDGALFRSDDARRHLAARAARSRACAGAPGTTCTSSPTRTDADTVWVADYSLWKSIDGGKTFVEVATPHGDNHDLWIDPADSAADDRGQRRRRLRVASTAAQSWSTIYNQPTAQFYHVCADDQQPYRIYGSQQDNWAISLPSQSHRGAITAIDWVQPGGGESGYIAVKPGDPNIVVGGAIGSGPGMGRLIHYDHRTGQERIISVWPEAYGMGTPPAEHRYRFQWTFPVFYSRWDPRELWIAGNRVFRSIDEGQSWEVVSPDLTRNDPAKLGPSGGPITRDNTGAEVYCTIFALVESPHERDVLWAGTDDGLVHLSRDRGRTWQRGDAARPAGVGADQRARAVAARRRPPATSRPRATSSTTRAPISTRRATTAAPGSASPSGLPAGEFTRVDPRGPEPARAALRRHRDRRLGLARRRRRVAAAARRTCRSRRSTT